MNTSRIYSLLKYDLALNKHKLGLTMSLITIIYFCFVILYFTSKNIFEIGNVSPEFPTVMAGMISSFFNYAQIAMVFVITSMLHMKFTNPRSATSYLSLPGTSAEKFVVMILDYALGALAVLALMIVCHYITMLVCWIVSPEVSWAVNPFVFNDPMKNIDAFSMIFNNGQTWNEFVQQPLDGADEAMRPMFDAIVNMIKVSVCFQPFFIVCELLVYACVNMLFRTNGQLKTIALGFAAYFVLLVVVVICSVVVFSHVIPSNGDIDPTAMAEIMGHYIMTIFTIIKYGYYLSPVVMAGLGYIFYRQICRKQAK